MSRTIDPTTHGVCRQARPTAAPGSGGGTDDAWSDRLLGLHHAVRSAVLASGRERTTATNAKGDVVTIFDLAANDAALEFLETLSVPLLVDSEESEPRKIGAGVPGHRLVLDPVDGSDNWARGLPLSAVCCAVLAVEAPLHPDCVESAVVGPLDWETPLLASRGSGARCGAAQLETSAVRHVVDAVISVELNHFAPPPYLASVMAAARGVRSCGCASRALAFVACGALDAHLDLRGRLTPESYLAATRLVIEAGGCVAGLDGAPLPIARHLTDRVDLIAASSEPLCREIVERLADGRR